jgi:hypothetical protein
VGFFRFDDHGNQVAKAATATASMTGAATRPRAASVQKAGGADRGPVGRMQSNLATALKEESDWQEF